MGPEQERHDFEMKVAGFFRRRGANVQRDVLLRGTQLDLFVIERLASGIPVRTVVEVKFGRSLISREQIAQFAHVANALRSAGEADIFLLVASSGFTRFARDMAHASGIHLLEAAELDHGDCLASTFRPPPDALRLGSPATRRTVFVSYSHTDRRYLQRLQVHLRPLEREGLITFWADTNLRPGDRWREEVRTAIDSARIAVVLVSADFLASEFIAEDELPPLLETAKREGARIMPVILSACGFTRHKSLANFQAVNDPARPLAEQSRAERERLWDSVASEIIESVRR